MSSIQESGGEDPLVEMHTLAGRVVVFERFPTLKRRAWSLDISAFNAVAVAVPVCPGGSTRK
jgi:hypothetical protein